MSALTKDDHPDNQIIQLCFAKYGPSGDLPCCHFGFKVILSSQTTSQTPLMESKGRPPTDHLPWLFKCSNAAREYLSNSNNSVCIVRKQWRCSFSRLFSVGQMLLPHEKDARLLYCSLVDRRCFRGENLNPTKTSQIQLPESTTQPHHMCTCAHHGRCHFWGEAPRAQHN